MILANFDIFGVLCCTCCHFSSFSSFLVISTQFEPFFGPFVLSIQHFLYLCILLGQLRLFLVNFWEQFFCFLLLSLILNQFLSCFCRLQVRVDKMEHLMGMVATKVNDVLVKLDEFESSGRKLSAKVRQISSAASKNWTLDQKETCFSDNPELQS